jgi:hypothetical protein
MNGKRIILGGLAAGIAMAVLDSLTNAVLFRKDWADAYAALRLTPSDGAVGAFWIIVDMVSGERSTQRETRHRAVGEVA